MPDWIRNGARSVTPTGRGVLAVGLLCVLLGRWSGITELSIIGWMCLVLLVLAVPWLLLPAQVKGLLSTRPASAMAGDRIQVRVSITQLAGLRVWRPLVRIATSAALAPVWARMATLRPGVTVHHSLPLDTPRRGVVTVGPVEHLRTDPLGLLRARREWAPAIEVYVRPRMIGLHSLGLGQLRDMEGVVTDTVSMSDLAFHALREYVPGDDLRHVHWRSSARAGEVLVRQYQESRRNRTTVVVDCAVSSYGTTSTQARRRDAFELGASVAASLIALAGQEGETVTLVGGSEVVVDRSAHQALDGLCRMEPDTGEAGQSPTADALGAGLAHDISRALALTPETGTLFVITGAAFSPESLAGALWVVPPDVRVVLLQIDLGGPARLALAHGREVRTVGSLGDLPGLLGAR